MHRSDRRRPHQLGMGTAGRTRTPGPVARICTPRFLAAHGYAAREKPAGRSVAVRCGAVASVVVDAASCWQGRDVLITGHTGFKGGWLCLWLQQLGARVHGYAL